MLRFGLILIITFLTWPLTAFSQRSDQVRKWIPLVSANVRPTYAFSSFRDDVLQGSLSMDNAKTTRFAPSVHLSYGFSFTEATKQGRLYPGAWQGIGAGINFFGNPKGLGTPISVYLFQGAPIVNFNKRLSLYYEWNFGASFGWKPCDGIDARSNLIVGSRVNAYINLGCGISWKVSKNLSLIAGLEVTHFSNGNTSFPNPGVNMAGVRIGLSRSLGTDSRRDNPVGIYNPDTLRTLHRLGYDLTLYGAWRRRVYRGGVEPVLLNGHFAVAGMSFAPMWGLKRNLRLGGSADIQWDESSAIRGVYLGGEILDGIRFSPPPFFSQVSIGLAARAEWVMPLFSVNLGVGYNFIGPKEARASYQMANLKIRVYKGLFVNIGYQLLNFQRQNNLMLGFGYSFL